MDKRMQHTELLLKQALTELMKEQPVEKITTTELCRRANINRNTFYSHYRSVEELLDSIETKMFESISEKLSDCDDITQAITEICTEMKQNRELCTALYSGCNEGRFTKRMFEFIHKRNMEKMSVEANELNFVEKKMVSNFTVAGASAIIGTWIANGMAMPPERVAKFMIKTIFFGVRSLTK